MFSHKVGRDLATLRKNFQTYKPVISPVSRLMFWASVVITISFMISQVYLNLAR